MKNIITYSLILIFALLIGGCKGEQGDVGPAGTAGTAGKNGTNGTAGLAGSTGGAGSTGDAGAAGKAGGTGATGGTGAKGEPGTISMTYTDWKLQNKFEKVLSSNTSYSDITDIDVAAMIPKGSTVSLSRNYGYLTVTDNTGNPIGFLYTYYKISEKAGDIIFPELLDRQPIGIETFGFGFNSQSVSSFMTFNFNSNTFNSQTDFLKEINDRKPSVRLVFLPLALRSGRMAHVNMKDYNEVKLMFNLPN